MKLNQMTLHDFKGIHAFSHDFEGKSAKVYGCNGAGKSTMADAFVWLLTGKNLNGEVPDVFPVDESENRIHPGQEPSVECSFTREDGTNFTIKRGMTEKWSKKSGHAEKTYTGDEGAFWIDGVPTKKGDYEAFVSQNFAPDDVLRILSNSRYFLNMIARSEDMRSFLMNTFGDIPDAEVLASSPELTELAKALENRTVDGYRTMMKAHHKETCQEFDDLFVRIDEAAKSLVDDVDAEAAKSAISKIQVELPTLRQALEVPSNKATAEMEAKLAEAQHLLQRENADWAYFVEASSIQRDNEWLNRKSGAEYAWGNAKTALSQIDNEAHHHETMLARCEKERQTKLEQWKTENAKQFDASAECPTCGQQYPAEKLAEMEGNWKQQKSSKLEAITAEGKDIAEQIKTAQSTLDGLVAKREEAQAKLAAAEAELRKIEAEHKPYEPPADLLVEHNKKVEELEAQIAKLEGQKAKAANTGNDPERAAKEQRIAELEAKLAEQQALVAKAKAGEEAQQRITEYEKRQKELVAIRENCEKMLHLCDEFTRIKVGKITEHINSFFQIVRWKMFKENKTNDGLMPCCEAIIEGKPYKAQNRARQMAADLDIVCAIGKKLGITVPVFVDNSESSHEDYGIDTTGMQIIRTYVSEADSELRVEQ